MTKAFAIGRLRWFVGGLLVTAYSFAPGSALAEHPRSALYATVALSNGTQQRVGFEGVGCTEALCSRVAIATRSNDLSIRRTYLDTIAAITDITDHDALFRMKDGTSQRLSVVPDNRVLYLGGQDKRFQKLDLARIKSVTFQER
jgi:hypothetical protein